jgi:hypothetical protein
LIGRAEGVFDEDNLATGFLSKLGKYTEIVLGMGDKMGGTSRRRVGSRL